MAFTTPTTRITGELITASIWNTDLVEDIKFLANPPTVRVKDSTDQSIANNTLTKINWDGEDWDTDVMHDNATNNTRLTAKTAGMYQVWFAGTWADNSTGARLGLITIGAGATALAAHRVPAQNFSDFTLYAEVRLAVNDFVEAQVLQTSGGALNFGSTNAASHFGMTWISL